MSDEHIIQAEKAGRVVATHINTLIDAKRLQPADLSIVQNQLNEIKALVSAEKTADIPTPSQPINTMTRTGTRATTPERAVVFPLVGMDCHTGKRISGREYLKQRLIDAIVTRKGSQCLKRERGSNLFYLIDQAMNPKGRAKLIATITHAISSPHAGLPDFVIQRTQIISMTQQGQVDVELTGIWYENGNPDHGQTVTLGAAL